jgi:AraC-like DNA-binding protein
MFQETVVDTLSATLMRMKLKASNAAAINAGGDWALESPGQASFMFHLVLKGEQWLAMTGEKSPHHIQVGDCVLLSGGRPFVLTSSLSSKKQKRMGPNEMWKTLRNGVMTINGGGDCLSIGTQFQFDGHLTKVIFARLPSVIHIPAGTDQSAILRWTLERFREEFLSNDVGRSLVINHLAPIMLLQTLRAYLHRANEDKNWLVALCNPKLSKAIEAMHADYNRAWSLEQLAQVAGMSRSRFALHFKQQVGIAPMDYLTQWRMQIACDLLKEQEQGIAAIAHAVGYESESAFSVAFTKVVGLRPGAYQRSVEKNVE